MVQFNFLIMKFGIEPVFNWDQHNRRGVNGTQPVGSIGSSIFSSTLSKMKLLQYYQWLFINFWQFKTLMLSAFIFVLPFQFLFCFIFILHLFPFLIEQISHIDPNKSSFSLIYHSKLRNHLLLLIEVMWKKMLYITLWRDQTY